MFNPQASPSGVSTILFFLFLSLRSSLGLLMPRPHAVDDLTRLLVSQIQQTPLTKKFRSSGLLLSPLFPLARDTIRDDELLR